MFQSLSLQNMLMVNYIFILEQKILENIIFRLGFKIHKHHYCIKPISYKLKWYQKKRRKKNSQSSQKVIYFNKNIAPENLVATITEVTKYGEVYVTFNKELRIPENYKDIGKDSINFSF